MRTCQNLRTKRLRLRLPLQLLAVGLATLAHGQTVPTQATTDEIDQWLHSGEPRMVAWGATFAAKDTDAAEVPILAMLAEKYQALPSQQYDSKGMYVPRTPEQKERFDSMQVVLDSLIQLHGTMSHEAIEAVLPDFPAQALTLFGRMPEPERSQFAEVVYDTRDRSVQPYDWHRLGYLQMIHLAAAILALNPPPGFNASLLNEVTVKLIVTVVDVVDRRNDGMGVGGPCGDSFGLVEAPGWPEPYTYVVEQGPGSDRLPSDDVLVPGNPHITSRRARSSSSCSTLAGLTSAERLLIAQKEAGPGAILGITARQYDTLQYPGAAGYPAALAAVLDAHEKPFRILAAALADRALLTQAEAAKAFPNLIVEVLDQRRDQGRTLSLPATLDPHVVVRPYEPDSGSLWIDQSELTFPSVP